MSRLTAASIGVTEVAAKANKWVPAGEHAKRESQGDHHPEEYGGESDHKAWLLQNFL